MESANKSTQEYLNLILYIFVKLLEKSAAAVYWGGFEEQVSQLPCTIILVAKFVVETIGILNGVAIVSRVLGNASIYKEKGCMVPIFVLHRTTSHLISVAQFFRLV